MASPIKLPRDSRSPFLARGSPLPKVSVLASPRDVADTHTYAPARQITPYEQGDLTNLEGGFNFSAVLLVNLINFMDTLGGNISTPILPFYAREFGASYFEIGKLYSAFAFSSIFSMPLLSHLSDKYGRRWVLLLCVFGNMVGSVWQAVANSYRSLLCARLFNGIFAGVTVVCQIYVADVVPADAQVEHMNYLLSSSQASVLFGPSIGAGLSALGLNVPLLAQAGVSAVLLLVVWGHLPESPEWLRLQQAKAPESRCHGASSKLRGDLIQGRNSGAIGIGKWGTFVTIAIYGSVAFCSMVAQMCIVSMFGIFAKDLFGLDSVKVGFAMTMGALTSVGTNIWISTRIQHRLGNVWAGVVGSVIVVIGVTCMLIAVRGPGRLALCVVGLMVAYQGIAINSGAVASASVNVTNMANRSKVVTGVRMMKSLGAVAGPIIGGAAAQHHPSSPFIVAATFAFCSGIIQCLTMELDSRILALVSGRRTVGLASGLLQDGGWQDEVGTREEVSDLGEFVANLLTSRHYKWVTYNGALKRILSDFFPELPTESDQVHQKSYNRVRELAQQTAVEKLLCSPLG